MPQEILGDATFSRATYISIGRAQRSSVKLRDATQAPQSGSAAVLMQAGAIGSNGLNFQALSRNYLRVAKSMQSPPPVVLCRYLGDLHQSYPTTIESWSLYTPGRGQSPFLVLHNWLRIVLDILKEKRACPSPGPAIALRSLVAGMPIFRKVLVSEFELCGAN